MDWILVLDDVKKKYPEPGKAFSNNDSNEERTENIYWYGWSLTIPEEYVNTAGTEIILKWTDNICSEKQNTQNITSRLFFAIDQKNSLNFTIQLDDAGSNSIYNSYKLIDDVSDIQGKRIEFVLNSNWTSSTNGFIKLWVKVDDNNYFQKINYNGATLKKNESIPELKAYFKKEVQPEKYSSKTILADEIRIGGVSSSFNDVAPGVEERIADAKNGVIEYVNYYSLLNKQYIPVMVYTPPGYNESDISYPVIYNLHGAGGGSPARQWDRIKDTLTKGIESKIVCPMIYVFVNGLGDSFYANFWRYSVYRKINRYRINPVYR